MRIRYRGWNKRDTEAIGIVIGYSLELERIYRVKRGRPELNTDNVGNKKSQQDIADELNVNNVQNKNQSDIANELGIDTKDLWGKTR